MSYLQNCELSNVNFNDIAAAAFNTCDSELSFIDLQHIDRWWCKSKVESNIELDNSIRELIDFITEQQAFVEIVETDNDDRFKKLTISGQTIKHFAGIPLIMPDGVFVGVLCVLNTYPQVLTMHQKIILELLANQVVSQLQLCDKNKELTVLKQHRNRVNEDIDEFSHIAVHDLNSPILAIKNLSSWIGEDASDVLSADNLKHLDMIQNSIKRMESMMLDLRDYSSLNQENNSSESMVLSSIVNECMESLDITQKFEIITTDCEVNLPKKPFMRVLTNLLSNAVNHHDQETGCIKINCQIHMNEYEFSVVDDGPGISSKYQDVIFKPFQRLTSKDKKEHSGFGLAKVIKVLAQYEGTIDVKSQLEQGTTFVFTWPKSN